MSAARVQQRLNGLPRTEAIAVGFDRRSGRDARAILKPTPVRFDSGAIDSQSQRVVHGLAVTALLLRVEIGPGGFPDHVVELLDGQLNRLVEAISR